MQVAFAWLLHRAPNILLIPGTSSIAHLHENLAAAELALTDTTLTELGTEKAFSELPMNALGMAAYTRRSTTTTLIVRAQGLL